MRSIWKLRKLQDVSEMGDFRDFMLIANYSAKRKKNMNMCHNIICMYHILLAPFARMVQFRGCLAGFSGSSHPRSFNRTSFDGAICKVAKNQLFIQYNRVVLESGSLWFVLTCFPVTATFFSGQNLKNIDGFSPHSPSVTLRPSTTPSWTNWRSWRPPSTRSRRFNLSEKDATTRMHQPNLRFNTTELVEFNLEL